MGLAQNVVDVRPHQGNVLRLPFTLVLDGLFEKHNGGGASQSVLQCRARVSGNQSKCREAHIDRRTVLELQHHGSVITLRPFVTARVDDLLELLGI